MDDWMEAVARELGDPPVTDQEQRQVLRLARDVAHAMERRMAPVAAYLAGIHAGRMGVTDRSIREAALGEALAVIQARLPQGPPDPR